MCTLSHHINELFRTVCVYMCKHTLFKQWKSMESMCYHQECVILNIVQNMYSADIKFIDYSQIVCVCVNILTKQVRVNGTYVLLARSVYAADLVSSMFYCELGCVLKSLLPIFSRTYICWLTRRRQNHYPNHLFFFLFQCVVKPVLMATCQYYSGLLLHAATQNYPKRNTVLKTLWKVASGHNVYPVVNKKLPIAANNSRRSRSCQHIVLFFPLVMWVMRWPGSSVIESQTTAILRARQNPPAILWNIQNMIHK